MPKCDRLKSYRICRQSAGKFRTGKPSTTMAEMPVGTSVPKQGTPKFVIRCRYSLYLCESARKFCIYGDYWIRVDLDTMKITTKNTEISYSIS